MNTWHLHSLLKSKNEFYHKIDSTTNGIIYILDTELNLNHPELLNAKINLLNEPIHKSGHATSAMSLICGRSLGIAPNATVYYIESGRSYNSIYDAVSVLIEHRVSHWRKPASVYLGWNFRQNELPQKLSDTLTMGLKSIYLHNSMIFSSVGFEGLDSIYYPASENIVVSVGAHDQNNFACRKTNKSITAIPDVYAPGEDVFCAVNNDEYEIKSGTSYAAALAAGAFLFYLNGSLSAKESLHLYMNNINFDELDFHLDDLNVHNAAQTRSVFLGLRHEKLLKRLSKQ